MCGLARCGVFVWACTTVAFVIYFRLIADVGPTKALTETFLMPGFGMFWGALLLGEHITLVMLAGCGLILLGTALVFGLLRSPFGRRNA